MWAKTDLVIKKVMILSFRRIRLLPPELFSSEKTRTAHHSSARFTLYQRLAVILLLWYLRTRSHWLVLLWVVTGSMYYGAVCLVTYLSDLGSIPQIHQFDICFFFSKKDSAIPTWSRHGFGPPWWKSIEVLYPFFIFWSKVWSTPHQYFVQNPEENDHNIKNGHERTDCYTFSDKGQDW